MKVIIDTDPGTDDALALIMALNWRKLDIQALTTVGGNASLARATRNALRLLEYMGRTDIPVHKGASRPLKGRFEYAYHFHGPGGLTARLPLPKTQPAQLPAAEYIISAASSMRGELVLVALGPLTNVATALMKERRLPEWLKEVVVMGGAIEVEGNVTPYAEFNIFDDPEAANVVFSSGVPVTLVGLDVCRETFVTRDDREWFSCHSQGEKLAARILTNWFRSHPDHDRYHLCDPLAMAAVLRPDLLTYRQATVTVETDDRERRGKTTAAYGDGDVRVASGAKAAEAKAAVRALLT
jgi:inosine-uridine nucleoside N-ribohydrolase